MNSREALIVGVLFSISFICGTISGAESEFDTVPKLYEEIGCTEVKNSGGKGFEQKL